MNKKILVIGSSNTDMILKVPNIPKPGETVLGKEFQYAAGGKGANQAVAAARAGGHITFIGRVGQDSLGKNSIKGLVKEKINVDHVEVDETETSGVAFIFVAKNGENSIGVASGANRTLSPDTIKNAQTAFDKANILLMQLEIPMETVTFAADIAKKNKVKIILNPAPAQKLNDHLLKKIHILTPNRLEAEMLTGIKIRSENDAFLAAKKIMELGVEKVVITLGSSGALFVENNNSVLIPGFKVKAVDTTAAGDVFNGAMAVALTENKTLSESVRFANAAAAISVTRPGAQPSIPTREQINTFLDTHR